MAKGVSSRCIQSPAPDPPRQAFTISRPNNDEFQVDTYKGDGWKRETFKINDNNTLQFTVTERTPTRISGTFTSSGTYVRYIDSPYAIQHSLLEYAPVRISGRWHAVPGTMPEISGAGSHRGCGLVRVLSKWTAFDLQTRTLPEWEGKPPCTVTGSDFRPGDPWFGWYVF